MWDGLKLGYTTSSTCMVLISKSKRWRFKYTTVTQVPANICYKTCSGSPILLQNTPHHLSSQQRSQCDWDHAASQRVQLPSQMFLQNMQATFPSYWRKMSYSMWNVLRLTTLLAAASIGSPELPGPLAPTKRVNLVLLFEFEWSRLAPTVWHFEVISTWRVMQTFTLKFA